jgi:putative transposase
MDAEILALRHQITVLERQLGDRKVRFTPADRTFLAALLAVGWGNPGRCC